MRLSLSSVFRYRLTFHPLKLHSHETIDDGSPLQAELQKHVGCLVAYLQRVFNPGQKYL